MNNSKNFDFTIIGAGIAGAASMLSLLDSMLNEETSSERWKIAVIDKNAELWRGLPYGYRSSSNSLTITTLKEFIPPTEREGFLNWLDNQKEQWLERYAIEGGEIAKAWIERNQSNLVKNNWEEMYIPRHLFGDYISEKVSKKIELAETMGKASISYFTGELKRLDKAGDAFMLDYEGILNAGKIFSQKVILSTGSTPMKSISNPDDHQDMIYINDTYYPSLDENLQSIESRLKENTNASQKNHLLVVGTNASSIEFLYLINGNPELKNHISQVVVISPSGILPNRITDDDSIAYRFEGLESLKKERVFDSGKLYETIEEDLKIAYENGAKMGDLYHQVNDLIVSLLEMLPDEEKQDFYCKYGLQYSKLIRRSGMDYSDGLDQLRLDGKLTQLKGKYLQLKKNAKNPQQVILEYADQDGSVKDYKDPFGVVVNCGGFENLDQTSSPLLKHLVDKGLCTINCTNRGLEVNEKFEICEGFYVLGPLLGGIFNSKARLWHVENAKSIFKLANLMKGHFSEDLGKMVTVTLN